MSHAAEAGKAVVPDGFVPRIAFWIAVCGGAGLSPFWPGTMGTLGGVALAWLLVAATPVLTTLFLAALFAAGVWAASAVAADHGSGDPQFVVVDETFGAAATLVLLPAEPLWWLAGFLAFRLFDVVKPWPASFAHRHVRGGLGIMLDDAIAAIYSAGLLLGAHATLAAWG